MVSPTLTIESLVGKTDDLPSMPEAALAVMREADSATGSAQGVATHLSRDQSLSARVLRLANSPFYGLTGEVVDLQQGVVVLGMRCVRNLAVVAGTYTWMCRPLRGYRLEPGQLWDHSISVAVGAQLIARQTRNVCPETAFTAGLLHDLGKCVLSVWLENKLDLAWKYSQREKVPFYVAEQKLFGFDHQAVGAFLASKWGLPTVFVDAIAWHHEPKSATKSQGIVDVVHVADYLTMTTGFGLGGDGLQYDLDEEAFARIGLKPEGLEKLIGQFVDEVGAYKEMLDSISGD